MKRENIARVIFALLLLCSMAWSYTVTITEVKGGSTSPAGTKTVAVGSTLKITATPDEAHLFSSWTKAPNCPMDNLRSPTVTVTVNGDCTLKPNYLAFWEVTIDADAGGTVDASSKRTYASGSAEVTVTATPNSGYLFDKWVKVSGGEKCFIVDETLAQAQVHVRETCKIKAQFVRAYTVKLTAGTGGSTNFTSKTVGDGSEVDIVATPANGYGFYRWVKKDGSGCSISSTYFASTKMTVKGDCTIETDFRKEWKLTMVMGENGSSVSPSGSTVALDDIATSISATAKAGYAFGSWSVSGTNCSVLGSTSSSTYAYLQSDCTITANFVPVHTVTIKHVNWDGSGATKVTTLSVGEGRSELLEGLGGYPYKPSSWNVTSGTCTLSSLTGASTSLMMKARDCTVEVQYEHSAPVKIDVGVNDIKRDDYYQKNPDLTAYVLKTSMDTWYAVDLYVYAMCKYYGSDSSFSHWVVDRTYSPVFLVRGDGFNHYFTCESVGSRPVNVKTIFPLVPAKIEASKGGSVNYQGVSDLPSGKRLPVVATAEPYYKFVQWNVLDGFCNFANPKNPETKLNVGNSECYVRAEFEMDHSIVPELELVGVDRSEYPKKVCAEYTMTLNGSVYEPNASDFSLKENGSEIAYDLSSSIKQVDEELAVALVIDGSGSLRDLVSQIKETLAQFIDGLVGNVALSIIRYGSTNSGSYKDADVLHELSKDKASLKSSLGSYKADGITSTLSGVKKALDLLERVPGKKLMLVVTEGPTSTRTYSSRDLLARAQAMDVKIQSFYLNRGASLPVNALRDVDSLSNFTGGSRLTVTSVDQLPEPLLSAVKEEKNIPISTFCYAPKDTIPNGDSNKIELYYKDLTTEALSTIIWEKPKCVERDVGDFLHIGDADMQSSDPPVVPSVGPYYELITRSTTNLVLHVETQDFTGDCKPWYSVPVNVSCKNSGDVETFWLGSVGDGEYVTNGTAPKREGVAITGNGVLECYAGDEIVAVYQDHVYGTIVEESVTIHDDVYDGNVVETEQGFVGVDGSGSLDSVEAAKDIPFAMDIFSHSESIYGVDSIKVRLFTSQGDTLEVYAKETDIYSSIFRLEDHVSIVFDSLEMRDDRLEILMNGDNGFNSAYVYAEVAGDDGEYHMLDSFVAYYDFPKNEIAVYDGTDKEAVIGRTTESLLMYVNTWSSFDEIDEIGATLRCRNSGDSQYVKLVKMGDATDKRTVYGVESAVPKNELDAGKNDGALSCEAEDVVVAEYVSPYYRNPVSVEFAFADSVKTKGEFLVAGGSAALEYAETYKGVRFDFNVVALSPTVHKADSLDVMLYTSQGDTLWAKAAETGKYTSDFVLRDSVTVVYDSAEKKIGRLEVLMNGDESQNKVTAYARVVVNGMVSDVLDSISLSYDFPESDVAIYDGDDDAAEIDRATESLRVYVNTLEVANGENSVESRLYCRNSGDSEIVTLVEMGDTTGSRKVYGMEFAIPKNELVAEKNDGALSCEIEDVIVAEYASPYYKNPLVAEIAFTDSAVIVSLDSAEIYDRDGDGRADFVRMHFADVVDVGLLRVDTVFWNAEGHKGRGVSGGINVSGGKGWYEAELDDAFDYGVTGPEFAERNYLAVSKNAFNYSKKAKLADKMGAVPVYAEKRPGRISEGDLLGDDVVLPPDTLVVTLSEPLEIAGGASGKDSETWQKLFQYAGTCGGKKHAVALTEEPAVDKSGRVWTLVLPREVDVRVGHCLVTSPAASYQDAAGNAPAVGGVTVQGDDGDVYFYAIYPSPAISYDTVSAVKTQTRLGYKASVSIFDNLGHYIAQTRYTLKVDKSKDAQVGTIEWNQRSDDGTPVSSGVYIWKIHFVFEDGHKESRYIRSGVRR